jgi:PhnB protein
MPEINEHTPPPLTPHLCVSNADAAIEFYKRAFGAQELSRHQAPDGKRIMHATLLVNGGTVMLNDDFPEYRGGKASTAEALGGSPVVLHLQVKDADAAFNQAVAAGGTVVFPLADQFWGDRYGQIKDPFGLVWSIGASTRKLSEEEIETAARAVFK